MNRVNAGIIRERGQGNFDFDKKPFHRLTDQNNSQTYNIEVFVPCLYIQEMNGKTKLKIILCWKDQQGEQREFLMKIPPEDFYDSFEGSPYSLEVSYIGKFKNLPENEFFTWGDVLSDESLIVFGKILSTPILIEVAPLKTEKGDFTPQKFFI